jgi:hypothetical protein
VVKYEAAPGEQTALAYHQDGTDATLLSYNILLNPAAEFEGGGTTFRLFNGAAVTGEQGDAASHPSKLYHGGGTVRSGARYILVGFVELDTPGTRVAAAVSAGGDLLSVYAPAALQMLYAWDRNPTLTYGVAGGLGLAAVAAVYWVVAAGRDRPGKKKAE